jgi:hypothetical protein
MCDEMDWTTPRICRECGGGVHEHFGDEWSSGDDEGYWTTAHCHKCELMYDPEDYRTLKEM